jgi:peptide/nickel transport system substrate-binding protein
MLGKYPGKRLVWLFVAGMALTLIAAACGDDDVTPAAAPVDTAAITAAVQQAVAASAASAPKPLSATEISSMVAAAVAAASGDAVTSGEIEAAIAKAVAESSETATAAAEAAAAAVNQKYGGTLKVATNDFGTMDPALMGLSSGSALYSNLTYDNALVPWYEGPVKPELLLSWTINSDVTEYTFKVREGVKFHNGSDLTSEDIKFTFDRILNEETASPLRGQLSYITDISTPDDYTVVFTLDGANAFLSENLTDYHGRIVPSDVDIAQITSREFGSGPYILAEHNPAERTVMNRNPDYWREGSPFIDQIVFFYMPEQTTRLEALKSGAIDIVIAPDFSALTDLEANPNVVLEEASSAGVRVIVMNNQEGIFTDKNLRKALQYAFDRDFVREAALFGRGGNANESPIGPGDPYYWAEQPLVNQDIAKSKAFLAAAGYPDGIDLVLNTMDQTQHLQVALAFKESVAAAGIRVEVINNPTTTYWEEIWMNPCCNLVTSSWGGRPANEAVSVALRGGTVWDESYYANDRLDELLDLANAESDFDARKEYFREIQEILIEDVPSIYPMFLPELIAHRSQIKGVRAHPKGWVFMEDWWID